MMATTSLSPELASMDMFRAAIPFESQASAIGDRLCAIGQYRALARGTELPVDVAEDRLVFIASGAAKLVATSPSTKPCLDTTKGEQTVNRHVLAFHFPGDIVSVLRQVDGDFRLVALKDAELVIFSSNQFLDVAQDDPAVIRSVLATSLQALHRSRTRMMQMGHKSARQRIADFLLTMAERVCGCTDGACEFALPMSRRDIGDSLGLTIETVSRQFADLRQAGLVTTKGRSGVCLKDIDALASEAGRSADNFEKSQT